MHTKIQIQHTKIRHTKIQHTKPSGLRGDVEKGSGCCIKGP